MTTDLTRLLDDTLIDVSNPFGDKGTEHDAAKRMHAALVAVVGLHQSRVVYANETHCPLRSGLDHDMGRHVEDGRTGSWVCLDTPLTDECQTCTDEDGATADYPCPTVQAITAALTETKGDGRG